MTVLFRPSGPHQCSADVWDGGEAEKATPSVNLDIKQSFVMSKSYI